MSYDNRDPFISQVDVSARDSDIQSLISTMSTSRSMIIRFIGMYIDSVSDQTLGRDPQRSINRILTFLTDLSKYRSTTSISSKYLGYVVKSMGSPTANGILSDDFTDYDLTEIITVMNAHMYVGARMFVDRMQHIAKSKKSSIDSLRLNNSKTSKRLVEIYDNAVYIANHFKVEKSESSIEAFTRYGIDYDIAGIVEQVLTSIVFGPSVYSFQESYTMPTADRVCGFIRIYLTVVYRSMFRKLAIPIFCADPESPAVLDIIQDGVLNLNIDKAENFIYIATPFMYIANMIFSTFACTDAPQISSKDKIININLIGDINAFTATVFAEVLKAFPKLKSMSNQFVDILSMGSSLDSIETSRHQLSLGVVSNPYSMVFRKCPAYDPEFLKTELIPAIKNARMLGDLREEYTEWVNGPCAAPLFTISKEIGEMCGGSNMDIWKLTEHYLSLASTNLKMAFLTPTDINVFGAMIANRKMMSDSVFPEAIRRVISDIAILKTVNLHIEDPRKVVDFNPMNVFAAHIAAVSVGIVDYIMLDSCSHPRILANIFNTGLAMSYRSTFIPQNKFQKEEQFDIPAIQQTKGYTVRSVLTKLGLEIVSRANSRDIEGIDTASADTRYANFIKYLVSAILNNTITAEYAIAIIISTFDVDFYLANRLMMVSKEPVPSRTPLSDVMIGIFAGIGERTSDFFKIFHDPVKYTSMYMNDVEIHEKTIEKYVEPLAFITILQNVYLYLEHAATIDSSLTIPTGIEAMMFGDDVSATTASDTPAQIGRMNTYSKPINTSISKETSLISDVKNAVNVCNSIVDVDIYDNEWYSKYADKIHKG